MIFIKKFYKFIKMGIYSLLLGKYYSKNNIYFASYPKLCKKNTLTINGKNIYLGSNCHIGANIVINSDVMIASNVSFVGGDHDYQQVGVSMFFSGRTELKNIFIQDDVWIGHGAIILQGLTLGEGCVVAAGSVVTKNIEPYVIVGGNPARAIKNRFSNDELVRHKKIKYQDYKRK